MTETPSKLLAFSSSLGLLFLGVDLDLALDFDLLGHHAGISRRDLGIQIERERGGEEGREGEGEGEGEWKQRDGVKSESFLEVGAYSDEKARIFLGVCSAVLFILSNFFFFTFL